MGGYDEAYRQSIERPGAFWAEAARGIDWDVAPATTFGGDGRWFPDGRLNTCHNAVDRHVAAGRGEQAALIHDSPVTGTARVLTYAELLDQVARTAGMLRDLGVRAGDTVVVYMPMVPQAVIAMLACARLGAVHSVVFGGFAARELAMRIDHARPKVVLTASCGIEPARVVAYKPLLDEALAQAAHRPERCVILQRPQAVAELTEGRDLDWERAVREAEPAGCVSVAATDPLYILYTSGTTGSPKGVVRDNGGHAVALHWSMAHVFGAAPGEVYWAASDVGWVVGHSYIVYAPLLAGCTSVLYEGKPVGTPDPGAFWRVVATYGVRTLFTAPTAIRAIKKEDPSGNFAKPQDLSALRYLFLAGERLDPDTYHWASDLLGIPVIDHWWQTETGWPVAANCVGIEPLPIRPGSPTKPVPGWDVHVLDADGNDCPPGVDGAVTVKLPLPPGALPTLYRDEARFARSYLERYPGHYLSGDGGHFDADGYLYVMGRIDDVINVAGHRLSTGSMEEVIAAHPDVAECAVIGVADELKGQLPIGFVVLKAGAERDPAEVERELAALVRERVGPVAAFRRAVVVARLPKTRSGKILRATMRDIADGRPYTAPSTIEDPAALPEIAQALKGI
ncbi:propionyl-CoA synthetase [Nonomuraea sp. KC401]|uniref:propionyl-CoA synthetase n=1 Tax=unclassified Nonomuraea TaxID=2593643 RepID=UPI0010FD1DB1|nr:propionyl-CoA synthetase [Nonomuraea sp. KC401]NBE99726.1 AMP-binding protein [Nonomuraea sp. K271]TLF71381.1 propionyl-CoA synthetase [Nonomuraea sp. KC401]